MRLLGTCIRCFIVLVISRIGLAGIDKMNGFPQELMVFRNFLGESEICLLQHTLLLFFTIPSSSACRPVTHFEIKKSAYE